ncbi:MAG TPA: hypothetical protein VM261_38725, partial [Kofleriaceae bacterium]|nr:hypothetical protein [Kofleriaceae bacterium]
MRSAACVVVAIASVAAHGCAPPCIDDRCSVKPPADVVARNSQANADTASPPAESGASMAPGTTAASSAPGATDLPGPGVTAWAARLGAQRGVIYAGGQLTIRY